MQESPSRCGLPLHFRLPLNKPTPVQTGMLLIALLAGRPGVGKTTAIRELSRMLADECQQRVVVVVSSPLASTIVFPPVST